MTVRSDRRSRWLTSFADLCLVLLGFFVLLAAGRSDPSQLAEGMRTAFGSEPAPAAATLVAARLFEPGEAVLRPEPRLRFEALGRRAALAGASVRIESDGSEAGTRRLDGWELSAARAAAIARAIESGGLPVERIALSIPQMSRDAGRGQQIRVTMVPVQR